jgi:hypothetical protein
MHIISVQREAGNMLIIKHTIETKASPKAIWAVWQDVEKWYTWDHGVEYSSIEGSFEKGTKGVLKPKGGPVVQIELTSVEPYKRFVSESKLFLAKIIFTHDIFELKDKTLVTHQIDMKGPWAFLFAYLIGRKMKKNLPQEMAMMIEMIEAL